MTRKKQRKSPVSAIRFFRTKVCDRLCPILSGLFCRFSSTTASGSCTGPSISDMPVLGSLLPLLILDSSGHAIEEKASHPRVSSPRKINELQPHTRTHHTHSGPERNMGPWCYGILLDQPTRSP